MPKAAQSPDGPASAPAAKPDSISAILTEMQRACAPVIYGGRRSDAPGIRDIFNWADRIEAAAERERAAYFDLCKEKDATIDRLLVERDRAIKARVPGDAAALREALESTEELLEHFAKPGTMLADAFALHMRDNRAALAALARNVDRPECRTRDEAWKVFERESAGMWAADWDAAFSAWLFDTKEKGAK